MEEFKNKLSVYQKQGDVCEESSSNNQQDQGPGKPEPKDNPENNNDTVICACGYFSLTAT